MLKIFHKNKKLKNKLNAKKLIQEELERAESLRELEWYACQKILEQLAFIVPEIKGKNLFEYRYKIEFVKSICEYCLKIETIPSHKVKFIIPIYRILQSTEQLTFEQLIVLSKTDFPIIDNSKLDNFKLEG